MVRRCSAPRYPASAHRCLFRLCGGFLRLMTIASSTSSSLLQSWTLAPLTTSDNGTPRPSTSRWRLLPFFSPVRRVRADSFLCQGRLHHRAIDALPSPRDALHVVVFRQTSFPHGLKKSRLLPFEKAFVDGAGAAKALSGQCLPLAARAQHEYDGLEHLACRLCRSTSARFANVLFVRHQRALRDQRLNTLPELVRNDPGISPLFQRITPKLRPLQLELIFYLFTDKF